MAWYNPMSWARARPRQGRGRSVSQATQKALALGDASSLNQIVPHGLLTRGRTMAIVPLPFDGQKSASVGQVVGFDKWKEVTGWWREQTESEAILNTYKASTWYYACVAVLASALSSIPLVVQKKQKDGKWEVVPDHPLGQLLESPNPFWSGAELLERIVISLYTGGNAVLHKVRAGNDVHELWLFGPDKVRPHADAKDFIDFYALLDQGKIVGRVEVDDVIHIQFPDPAEPRWGMAPHVAMCRAIESDVDAITWQQESFRNRAVPSGAVTFDHDLSPQQHDDASEMVAADLKGTENARTVLVLGNRAKWSTISHSPVEMDFLNSRGFTREEVCSGAGVPPVMIGIYDKATLNQVKEGRLVLWQDRVIPLCWRVLRPINRQLASEYEEGIRVAPDLASVPALRPMLAETIDLMCKLWDRGVPLNTLNEHFGVGLPPVPGGDTGWLPGTLQRADGMSIDLEQEEENERAANGGQDRRRTLRVVGGEDEEE